MTKTALGLVLVLWCVALSAGAAEFEDGISANSRGDYATALRIFLPLAENGDSLAQYNVGIMYSKGQGVTQNYATALKWWRLAAAQGESNSQYNLGWLYAHGEGVAQNFAEAVMWYRLSAAQGDVSAQYNLGLMYAKGEGTVQDYVHAHMWLNLAAALGKANAIRNRDIIAKRMNSRQIAQAKKMANDCQQRNFKGCD